MNAAAQRKEEASTGIRRLHVNRPVSKRNVSCHTRGAHQNCQQRQIRYCTRILAEEALVESTGGCLASPPDAVSDLKFAGSARVGGHPALHPAFVPSVAPGVAPGVAHDVGRASLTPPGEADRRWRLEPDRVLCVLFVEERTGSLLAVSTTCIASGVSSARWSSDGVASQTVTPTTTPPIIEMLLRVRGGVLGRNGCESRTSRGW